MFTSNENGYTFSEVDTAAKVLLLSKLAYLLYVGLIDFLPLTSVYPHAGVLDIGVNGSDFSVVNNVYTKRLF